MTPINLRTLLIVLVFLLLPSMLRLYGEAETFFFLGTNIRIFLHYCVKFVGAI